LLCLKTMKARLRASERAQNPTICPRFKNKNQKLVKNTGKKPFLKIVIIQNPLFL
jgi:hypothetical protein